jgi:hypothetical protein
LEEKAISWKPKRELEYNQQKKYDLNTKLSFDKESCPRSFLSEVCT